MEAPEVQKQRRTAPKEVRRRQLIEATISAISEKGMSGTTMAEVTGRAGLSAGIVSLHFDGKDDLLKSTLTYLSEELQAAWTPAVNDTSLSAAKRLWAVVDAAYQPHICTWDKIRVWFAFFGEARYRAFYRDMVGGFDAQRGQALAAFVSELAASEGRTDVNAEAMSEALESMSDGLWLDMMLYPDWMDPPRAQQRLWEYLSARFPTHFPGDARPGMGAIR
ncbi:MAG: TetR family transcriptional regulator C-terminal domain-containing protein [Pseudomonadota bacterium]